MSPIASLQRITALPIDGEASPVVLSDCGRKQLRLWWKSLGATTGAEIGVWEGQFARTICEVTGAHLYAVDPWAPQAGYIEVKNDAARMSRAFQSTVARLAPYRHTLMRMTSLEAAKAIPDRSLDFVYIDGNHLRDHVCADLDAWTPKVKAGGILAGHDYRVYPSKPFIQVVEAVETFTQARGIAPWFVFAADKSPSWAWVVS